MKTIKEWFESVKDETIRTELLENMCSSQRLVSSLIEAINLGAMHFSMENIYRNMAYQNQIELIPDNPKIKKSALDKQITGLQLKYELLKDVEIKDLTKRIESLEKIVNELKSKPIIINLGKKDIPFVSSEQPLFIDPLAKTTMHNENEQTNVVGNCSDLPEKNN
jgi:hypothetical protein